MSVIQRLIGLAVVIIGLWALLTLNGWLAFTPSDIAASTMLLSGFFFIVPALVWRRDIPWITFLFLPGLMAFAAGGILLYAGHTSWSELLYLWVVIVIALGLGFVGMYYFGPRSEWLRVVGIIICVIGLFLVSIGLTLFSPVVAARIVGSILLIGLGAAVAVTGFGRGKRSSSLAPPRQ